MSNPRVADVPERSRFELHVGDELAGVAQHRATPGALTLVHTEVDDAFGGQGLGSTLVRGTLDDARARGLDVRPQCPFVRDWIAKHPDYVDLVPDGERAAFGL